MYLFSGKGEGREKKKERNIAVTNIDQLRLTGILTRDQTHNLGMCSDWESNQWPFVLWDDIQPTEPPQSGQCSFSDRNLEVKLFLFFLTSQIIIHQSYQFHILYLSNFFFLLFNFYCIFPITAQPPYIPSPHQPPHCCPCPWDLLSFCSIPPPPNLPTTSCHLAVYLWVYPSFCC